jgi:hypothetical protein
MSPSILVKDCNTQQFVKIFATSSDLTAFLASEKQLGVDIADRYLVYKFAVDQVFCADEALDAIKSFGYLPSYDEYQA